MAGEIAPVKPYCALPRGEKHPSSAEIARGFPSLTTTLQVHDQTSIKACE
jgi:hypothetical protein